MHSPGDTIFALSSGAGRAGIAVVRLSGARASQALEALTGPCPAPRRAILRTVRDPGTREPIDQALVLWFPAPGSHTGEDCAELHLHGGRAVLRAALGALGGLPGLRMADPGEFTRRAFLNGKLDLTAAEGIADLVDAETEAQRRQALRQSSGALDALYDGWRTTLIAAMARVEAALDFADEADVPGDVIAPVRPHLTALSAALTTHLADARRGEILRDGFHVVLAGPPNAGKSSLLNALAQRDVAIVSPRAGTTRDVIEVRLDLGGLPVILSDTAGVRAAQGEIESDIEGEGIRRALARATAADLVLWVTDATAARTPPPPELEPRAADTRWVVNKSDLRCAIRAAACPRANVIHVSALTGAGIGPLVDQIAAEARARLGDATAAPALTRVRHRHELERCRAALDAAILGDPADLELRAEDLRLAATALGRVTGRVDVEDVLDQIFASFCIGK